MLVTQPSKRVYVETQSPQSFNPLPPPKTQKELESRVQQAKMIRSEAKEEANQLKNSAKIEADQLRASAAQHGKKAEQAQKGIEACNEKNKQSQERINQAQERIKQTQETNAKFAAILAKKQART